jgi:undecaprenyl diphosphate synthase
MKQIQHVAIIMDGNGRWAKAQNKDRTYGHQVGTRNVRNIAKKASDLNIKALTLYAFSTENWARPKKEVTFLMKLPKLFIDDYLQDLMENNIKLIVIGQWHELPKATVSVLKRAMEATKDNTGLILNFAMNYGSKNEIVHAVNHLISQHKSSITQEDLESALMTADLPPIDLCIRTGGEQRLSNFLLWQLAYSELYFTDVPWPAFSEEHLEQAIESFKERDRRFGGLK